MKKKAFRSRPVEDAGRAVHKIMSFPEGFSTIAYSTGKILQAAEAAHEANRIYCKSIGDDSQLAWSACPDWQAQSALNGVCFAIANGFPSPEAMHENWMKEKIAAGWVYGDTKNPDAIPPTHPCLVAYADLPEGQRMKDDIFRRTIMATLGHYEGPSGPTGVIGISETYWPRDNPADVDEVTAATDPDAELHEYDPGGPAGMLVCALAMVGLWHAPNFEIDVRAIGPCLALFFEKEPDAPAAAGLVQIRRTLRQVFLPDEDPRRVELALNVFKTAFAGMVAIADAEAKAEVARILAAQEVAAIPPREKDGPFDREGDRFELSALGKSVAKHHS